MKAIAAQVLLQAVLLAGIVTLSSGPALAGSIPVCHDYNHAGCADIPGDACNEFWGAETCFQLTMAPDYCDVTTSACTTDSSCSGSQVYLDCQFREPIVE